jgi:hypothetical protein
VAAAVTALARIECHGLPWEQAQLKQTATLARQILAFDYWPALRREQLKDSGT